MIFIGSGEKFLNYLTKEEIDLLSSHNDKETLKYFEFDDLYLPQYTWLIIYENNQIKGVIKTQVSAQATQKLPFYAINYVSIHKSFQGQGLAKLLLNELFSYYQGQYISGTRYSEQGVVLKSLLFKLARQYNVYFVDKDLLNLLSELEFFPETTQDLYEFYKI